MHSFLLKWYFSNHFFFLISTDIWAVTWDFQQCCMCDKQRLRSACVYPQSDKSRCLLLEYSMTHRLLTKHHLEFLSLKGGCTGLSESTHVKMPHCLKSHVAAQLCCVYSLEASHWGTSNKHHYVCFKYQSANDNFCRLLVPFDNSLHPDQARHDHTEHIMSGLIWIQTV